MSPSLLYTHIFFHFHGYLIIVNTLSFFKTQQFYVEYDCMKHCLGGTIYHPSYLIDPNIFLEWMIILIFKKYISCFHCESKKTWTESFIDFGGHWMVYGSTAIRILVSRTNLHLVFGIWYEKCLRGKNMELFS